MEPGIYQNLSNEEYHADKTAISKSGLDLIDKSPAHYKWATENPRSSTPAMVKGTLIHTLVLEPETFDSIYAVTPKDAPRKPTSAQRNAKNPSDATIQAVEWWDNWERHAAGKMLLDPALLEDARRIVTAVQANPQAIRILESAVGFEESIFAEEFETGVLCKCRPDIRVDGGIYDLKTTRNAAARAFSYSCRSYRYHVQAAYYTDLCRIRDLDVERFGFIAVDTVDMPYQCTVFHRLSDDAMQLGKQEYMDNLRVYAECVEKNEWPGYPESYDILELAGYAYDEEQDEFEEDAA